MKKVTLSLLLALCGQFAHGAVKIDESFASGPYYRDYSEIYRASYEDKPELADQLIQAGADVNDMGLSGHSSPLYVARSEEMVDKLVAAGADIEPIKKQAATQPLHEAVARNDLGAVKGLLKHGANVNAKDYENMTPLLRGSAGIASVELLKTLLDAGADTTAKDYQGRTALEVLLNLDSLYGKLAQDSRYSEDFRQNSLKAQQENRERIALLKQYESNKS